LALRFKRDPILWGLLIAAGVFASRQPTPPIAVLILLSTAFGPIYLMTPDTRRSSYPADAFAGDMVLKINSRVSSKSGATPGRPKCWSTILP
jgi:hypothetical protein